MNSCQQREGLLAYMETLLRFHVKPVPVRNVSCVDIFFCSGTTIMFFFNVISSHTHTGGRCARHPNGGPAAAGHTADGLQRRALQAPAGLFAQQPERGREQLYEGPPQPREESLQCRLPDIRRVHRLEVPRFQQAGHFQGRSGEGQTAEIIV